MKNANYSAIRSLCRICLTRSNKMIPMDSPLIEQNGEAKEASKQSVSILEAMEQVMSLRLIIHEEYPSMICAMCKSLLKMAYDLNVLFKATQATLANNFKDNLPEAEVTNLTKTDEEKAPVELIFGESKFDLNSVVIVEEEEEQNGQNFEGFLSNLGSAISAIFVNKSDRGNVSNSNKIINKRRAGIKQKVKNNTQNSSRNIIKNTESQNELAVDQILEINPVVNDALKKVYNCTSCDTVCATKSRLALHRKKCHTNDLNIFMCIACGLESSIAPGQNEILLCNNCGSLNTNILSTEIVKTIKTNPTEYLCDICGHISKNRSRARYHKQTHAERRFECDICHKKFHYKINFKLHVNSHANIRNHLCTICGKTFYYANALVYHMRMHTNERNFVCQFCDRRFYMQSTLKRHERTHTNDRPYTCAFCEKGFRSNGEKRKHEMIHTGERPYKCQFCEKTFVSKYNRLVHHMSHAGPHKCNYCVRNFVEVEFLKKHVMEKHKNIQDAIKSEGSSQEEDYCFYK